MNTIIEKQLKGVGKERVQSIVDSFFAGCTKYDLYELGIKFNTIPTKDLYTYQQILNNPRLTTEEQIQVLQSIPQDESTSQPNNSTGADVVTNNAGGQGGTLAQEPKLVDAELSEYEGYGFYFDNDCPECENSTAIVASQPFDSWYNSYTSSGNKAVYNQQAPKKVRPNGGAEFTSEGIPQFFTNVVEGNFNYIKDNLLKKVDDILSKGGEITIDMVGSASATASVSYNDKLSQRRNNSVLQWFLKQPLSGGTTVNTYAQNGKFKLNLVAKGEVTSIPIIRKENETTPTAGDESITTATGGNAPSESVNCTQNVLNLDLATPRVTDTSEVYSVPAMACRRVYITKISAKIKEDPTPVVDVPKETQDKTTTDNVQNILTEPTQSIKPEPQITVEQKIKDGISKKILRNLFSECDYFQVIKETDPMVYGTIMDKIKYFNPAFHSMTPEGLNSRLNFLHQCTRPGQTIPVIGPDGRPKYNDALNTSFGAPPILVLRVGDFFHTKIVPTSLGITYQELDLNPEGIGVQPMLAKISLSFNIIGGMGLKEPVQELQNALSFNYYANTEIYDERATATEDTSKMDQYVVDKITGGLPPVSPQQQEAINSVQPKKGGSTVGNIVDATTMDYTTIYGSLEGKLQEYFKTYYDSLLKINNDYGYGALQVANKDRNYIKGLLSPLTPEKVETNLYGKTNKYQDLVQKLVDQVKKDISDEKDPYLEWLKINYPSITSKQKRELQEKLTNVVTQRQSALLNVILNNTTNLVSLQNEINFIFRQLDVIASKTDGNMSPSNEPLIYDLSGDTFFAIANDSGSIFDVYTNKVKTVINDFNTLIYNNQMTADFYKTDSSTIQSTNGSCIYSTNGSNSFFGTCEENRFYILMSQIYLNSEYFTTFVNDITSGNEIKSSSQLVEKIKERSDGLKGIFTSFQDDYKEKFKRDIEDSDVYKTCTTWKIPDNTVKTCNYVYPAVGDLEAKGKKLKDLYSNNNLNEDKATFNGKVTLN
jgi:hypothetical protein